MIRYIVRGETLLEACVHASMMAAAEAAGAKAAGDGRGGDVRCEVGYVLCCGTCEEPIADHERPGFRCIPVGMKPEGREVVEP